MFHKIKVLFAKKMIWFFSKKPKLKGSNYEHDLDNLKIFFLQHSGINYAFHSVSRVISKKRDKWVGGQDYKENCIFIPNDENRFLIGDKLLGISLNSDERFKWTGGCVFENTLYCFPRSSPYFLFYKDGEIGLFPVLKSSKGEHHYGGVCTEDGVVYQPPRNSNYILKTNLKTKEVIKIFITPFFLKIGLRYCGSIIHPNGLIYFLPENNKVIVLDPKTDKWSFIGKCIIGMAFDAKVGIDGNIYGFSAYGKGILKINVETNVVEKIHDGVYFGAFGTKYGLNGILYSVPGQGENVWSFDVSRGSLQIAFSIKNNSKVKFAGGCTCKNGSIAFAPAEEDYVLCMEPDTKIGFPDTIYNLFIQDFY